MKIMISH